MSSLVHNGSDNERLLEELNDGVARSMVPVMVYLTILMLTGVVGNSMVCFYYGCKSRRSTNSIFICTVAVYDLASCILSIPIEIVDLRFFYMFTNSGACAFMRFVNHVAAIGSAFTLLVIAADRFRRICRPFKRQLRINEAKVICGLSILVAVFFSWPALVFYQSVETKLWNPDGVEIAGQDCTTTRDKSYNTYIWVFNGIYLISFILSTLALCGMYTLIGRVLYRHKQNRRKYSRPISTATNSCEAALQEVVPTENDNTTVTSYKESADDTCVQSTNEKQNHATEDSDTKGTQGESEDKQARSIIKKFKEHRQSRVVGNKNDINKNVFNVGAKNSVEITKNEKHLDLKTVKYTTIMLVITVVFIVSFLPYLVLVIFKAFKGDGTEYDFSVPFQIGIRSYFLNSALNPITYGFFNSKFRMFFFLKCCPCCRRQNESSTVSTSSGAS